MLRAIHFAAHHKRLLLWAPAADTPLTEEVRSEEALCKAKQSWLLYADNATAGIPGLLPLVRGLPMRFTDTIDASQGACKHTQCTLVDWKLHPIDEELLQKKEAKRSCAERTLTRVPEALLVAINNEQQGHVHNVVVKPQNRRWQRAEEALAPARKLAASICSAQACQPPRFLSATQFWRRLPFLYRHCVGCSHSGPVTFDTNSQAR